MKKEVDLAKAINRLQKKAFFAGKKAGMEQGMLLQWLIFVRMMLEDGEPRSKIRKFTRLSEKAKAKLRKALNAPKAKS